MSTLLPPGLHLHELLRRQLQHHLGAIDALPQGWHELLREVDTVYRAAE
jgi:hypothetical protein